jgi:nitric oxide reductase subunit B
MLGEFFVQVLVGLTLFCLRALNPGRKWKETPLKLSFWCLNLGLIFMVILSMLPVGLLQAWASIEHGTWYARSSEFMQSGSMQTLRWMRVPGDILFAIGAALFAWFVLGLLTGHSLDDKSTIGRRTHSEVEERDIALAGR